MSEELKPCPFCNGEAQRTESSGLVSCAFEECPAFLLAVPADNWNRRAQPAEAEGVGKWSQLKNLAEKATPGPWWVDSHGHRVSTEDGMQTVFIAADKMGPATRHPETGNLSHWPNDWDASYIVNASPDKILELIAALSAVTAERDGLAAARMAYANEFAPDENGDPDVGNVHANIRALKAERDRVLAEREGKVLVPTEPTEAMLTAYSTNPNHVASAGAIYRAMLSAAMAAKEA